MIPWKKLEEVFSPLYGRVGLPSHPIRKMAALLMLKHLYNLSDERVVAHWETNPISSTWPERLPSNGDHPVPLVIWSTLDTDWEKKK